ncbi:MAG: penicillin acylase family protein [Gemmatimonadales bacterium]|nr:penicillin acylase family protein [Gemmatimonadales bacterium]
MGRPAVVGLLIFAFSSAREPLAAQASLLDSARARLSRLDGEVRLAGLDSAVEVRRDRYGIPHIYAKTTHDLFFAQGYVVAQDRLWQMEMWRRAGEGRLAEVLGPSFVERDRTARLLKYRGDMDAEWASYAPDAREIVRAFVAGVNARIAEVGDDPPIEFSLLGFRPEPWDETVPLQRMGALSMTENALEEVRRAALVARLGRAKVEALLPPDPFRKLDPVPGLDLRGIDAGSLGAAAADATIPFERRDGSNNWVVSGAKTATGKPLLANDPHRTVALPSLRYLTHLVGPGWNVIGAGEPGLPGVAGGHNDRVGFGFTIVGMDQQDVYVERVSVCPGFRRSRLAREGRAPRCSWHGGRWVPLRVIHDTILVRGEAPRPVRLEFSHHGPIVGSDSARGRAIALQFVGSEPGTAGYLAQLALNRATDWTGFLGAASRWKLPTENLLYGDVDGNIGWVAAGLMPMRSWSGLLPVPGDGRYEWAGYLPFADLPSSFNPASGFIATANHNILPGGYDKPLAYDWAESFRYDRIAEVLRDSAGFTRGDFERLQHDELSLPARALVPLLVRTLAALPPVLGQRYPNQQLALELFSSWDYVMRREQAAPLVYAAWVRALRTRLLERLVGGAERARDASVSLTLLIQKMARPDSTLGPRPTATRDSLFMSAVDSAMAELTRELGPDASKWNWGALHEAPFRHPLARAFDLPAVPRGGDGHTVNATGGNGFRQSNGASYRIVIDFADFDNSTATSVPGQSGQPGSEFYGNLLPLWSEGTYFPLRYSRAAVERETAHLLWLRPVER